MIARAWVRRAVLATALTGARPVGGLDPRPAWFQFGIGADQSTIRSAPNSV